jgi:hypothetical protein
MFQNTGLTLHDNSEGTDLHKIYPNTKWSKIYLITVLWKAIKELYQMVPLVNGFTLHMCAALVYTNKKNTKKTTCGLFF